MRRSFFLGMSISLLLIGCLKSLDSYSQHELHLLDEYIKCFQPDTLVRQSLPTPPNDVVQVLESFEDTSKVVDALLVFFLKIYLSHLKCCNQSYELRDRPIGNGELNPMLKKFLVLTEPHLLEGFVEFIPSSFPYDWITKNQSKLKHDEIAALYEQIEFRRLEIMKGKI